MMAMRSLSSLTRVDGDDRGVTIVEFGFIAPLLALFVLGIVDLGQGLSERFGMQQAVNRALEMVQGHPAEAEANESEVDYSFIKTEAATAADVPESDVELTQWLECDGVEQDDYDGSCEDGQDTARYLRLRIEKTYQAHFLGAVPMVATGTMRVQ
jgi:Flp pilus assembly pilin Flp